MNREEELVYHYLSVLEDMVDIVWLGEGREENAWLAAMQTEINVLRSRLWEGDK